MKIISTHALKQSHGGDIFDNIGSGFVSLLVGTSVGLIFNEKFWEEFERQRESHSQGFINGFNKSKSDFEGMLLR